jgi:uroporphyrinogen III methyltransferase/synthase
MSEIKNNKPLDGITIVITRARAQAESFASKLESHGAKVLSCPTIEIVPLDNYDLLDEAIENLFGYDWIIFTSVNGAEHFLERFESLGHDITELYDLRVCAVGEATSVRLRDSDIHVDVVPRSFTAEGVFESLSDYLGGIEQLNRLNFLMPRALVSRDYLPKSLEAAGARADDIPVYRTIAPKSPEFAKVKALIQGGGVDCITFTSSSTVSNFAQLFETKDLSKILEGVKVACIGEITATTATEFGLTTDVRPPEYTIPALTDAIVEYFSKLRD